MDIITELFKPIQCYACFVHCKHLRNECPIRNNPLCSNCSQTGHSYTDCENYSKCCNCSGPHPATAHICPFYHRAIETLKPKIAIQLAHYTNTNPDTTLTPGITGTEIFRTAAITSKNTEEFLLSLFNSCKTFTDTVPTGPQHDNPDITSHTAIQQPQASTHHTQQIQGQTQEKQLHPDNTRIHTHQAQPQTLTQTT